MQSPSSLTSLCMLVVILYCMLTFIQVQAAESPGRNRRNYDKSRMNAGRSRDVRRRVAEEEQREPLTLKRFDETIGWIDPRDPEDEAELFYKYLDVAYRRAAVESEGPEGVSVRARNLPTYFLHVMDMDRKGLQPEEHAYLETKVAQFRKQEGLVDDEQILNHGYLLRGNAYNFVKEVHQTLAANRRLVEEARYSSAANEYARTRGRIT